MTYQKAKEEIIESSPQKTDAGKEELYLYSLRKIKTLGERANTLNRADKSA